MWSIITALTASHGTVGALGAHLTGRGCDLNVDEVEELVSGVWMAVGFYCRGGRCRGGNVKMSNVSSYTLR
jgi:hypothetical protein